MQEQLVDILNAQRISNDAMAAQLGATQQQLTAMSEAMTHDRNAAQQGLMTLSQGVQQQHHQMQQAVLGLTASRQRDGIVDVSKVGKPDSQK